MRTHRCRLFVAVVFLGLLSAAVSAQETRGQISGRVQDPSGAVVVGVNIRVLNTATNVEYPALTNETGAYLVPLLIPGTYRVSADHPGFRSYVRDGIMLRTADRLELDINLEVGGATEAVVVRGEAPLLDVGSASMGQVIDNRRIADLPLKDGNPMMLAALAPGVMPFTTGGATRPYDNAGVSRVQVDGVSSGGQEFTMDGAPNITAVGRQVAYMPPIDVVDEFKVQSVTFDASIGYSPGASISVSLKSGTDRLHGSAYEFVQNPVLNANDFFSNRQSIPRAVIQGSRWGGSASGPVQIPRLYDGSNRTFFTVGYEGIHYNITSASGNYTTAVPTSPQRQGDLSNLLKIGPQYQIYDPATIAAAPNGRFSRQAFPENIIPASRITKIGSNLVNFYPLPNQPGTVDGKNNWTTPNPAHDRFYSFLSRIDHNIGTKDRFFVRSNYNHRVNNFNQWLGNDTRSERWNLGWAFDNVYIFRPSLLLNTHYSYNRYVYHTVPKTYDLAALGFSPDFVRQLQSVNPQGVRLPQMTVGAYGQLQNTAKSLPYDDVHDVAVNLTGLVGSHNLRFGTGYRVYRENKYDLGYSAGTFAFSTGWTNGPLDSSPGSPIGQDLAGLLLGLPTSGSIPATASFAEQSTGWSVYIQDDWRIAPKLTLSFGLRYELEGPTTERFNRTVRQFDFTAASPIQDAVKAAYAQQPIPEVPADAFRVFGGLTFAGVQGNPRTLWPPDRNNLMPRFGFAYQPDRKTILRGGYGIFYDQLGITGQSVNQTGFSQTTQFVPSLNNGLSFIANLSNPFPQGINRPLGAAGGLMTFVGQGVSFFNPRIVNPYMQRWALSVQRMLGPDTLLEVAYVGNRGTKLVASPQLDAIPARYLSTLPVRDQATINSLSAAVRNPFYPLLPGTSLAGTTVQRSQLLRPYPQFTSITGRVNSGFSWYHAMQTRLEKRLSAGYTVAASWTWSKFMQATEFLNPTDPLPYRVISDQDRTQRFVISGIWELPLGRDKRFLPIRRGLAGGLVSGWQAEVVFQGQSGPSLGFGNAIFNGNLKDIPLPRGQRNPQPWFNTNAGFETDPRKQLASNIITLPLRFSGIRGDGLNWWDVSLIKNTVITEALRLQFRAEFINAFNHPQFAAPATNPASTTFGQVTSCAQWPRVVSLGLKLKF